ncbi:molybdenum cofactor guanylyltransferase [Subtercola lobariae]|uniref:MobA-like NTP transferase domain-containing protein n=1 Tax=Subtercola lobariae TaxID=1588641 RepID=A0A917AZC1_9MICO|nr:NTP transferase domain-containing protein [Subtercola lobariae]GGF10823.1 hypothetical protein GCM10011399_00800 [Subtercola lobariae]
MNVDAIVLAGGRSSRLGGVAKAGLVFEGRTLLQRTLDAVPDARRTIVVGDTALRAQLGNAAPARSITFVREDPPFAGPAAAVAAGLDALAGLDAFDKRGAGERGAEVLDAGVFGAGAARAGALEGPGVDWVFVLACDMPEVGAVVELLRSAVVGAVVAAVDGATADSGVEPDPGPAESNFSAVRDGIVAVDDDGRRQLLAGLYRRQALMGAVERAQAAGPIVDLSVRALLGHLDLIESPVQNALTHDVDTWHDALTFGISRKELAS